MQLPDDWRDQIVAVLHGERDPDPAYFAGGPWHDPLGQIGVYQRQVWLRLIDAVREEVPGWRHLHGEGADAVIEAYLEQCPSQSWTLTHICDRFWGWLQSSGHPAAEVEMARLDWAVNAGFIAGNPVPITPAELAAMPPLQLTPPTRLLRNAFNVHLVRSAVMTGAAAPDLVESPTTLVVFRRGLKMRHYALDPLAFRLLECIRDGQDVPAAIETVFSEGASEEALAAGLGGWFQLFAQKAWVQVRG